MGGLSGDPPPSFLVLGFGSFPKRFLMFQDVPAAGPGPAPAPANAPAQAGTVQAAPQMAPAPQPNVMLTMVLPMVLVFGVMMFLNSRKQKKEDSMRESLKAGDRVVSQSGLLGEIASIEGKIAKVKLAPGTTVQMLVTSISPIAALAEEKK